MTAAASATQTHPQPDTLATERLILQTTTSARLAAIATGGWPGVEVSHAWPPDQFDRALTEFLARHLEQIPGQRGWHRFVLLVRPGQPHLLIGAVGVLQRESGVPEGELGYGICLPYQGQGYATEAVAALLIALASQGTLETLVSYTYPHLAGSTRVMEKLGFTADEEDANVSTVRFRLRLRPRNTT